MCYAYAALSEGAPFIMGAPNTTVDIPAMWELAEKTRMPIAGKDFKTGQTLVKSGFAPIIGTRCLGLSGWFSTNILGNRDGLVLDEPANFRTKEVSKLSTLETILKPDVQPDLYGHGNDEDTQYYHKVRINYYPPRNDNKEGWDNIDIFGWMGYPMQIKINFLCRDSILAALPRSLPAQRPRRARRPLRHAALPLVLPQVADARLHAGRGGREPSLPAVHNAEECHP